MLILVQFCVDLFRHLREGIGSVFRPEEVFRIKVIGLLLSLRDDDSIELDLKTVRDECLIRPSVGNHRNKIDVPIEYQKYWGLERINDMSAENKEAKLARALQI